MQDALHQIPHVRLLLSHLWHLDLEVSIGDGLLFGQLTSFIALQVHGYRILRLSCLELTDFQRVLLGDMEFFFGL